MNPIALAAEVALRHPTDYPDDKCAAWMESAERVCGKPATVPWLCKRHEKVAAARREKRLAREAARQDRYRELAKVQRPRLQEKLDAVEAEIARLTPAADAPFDHGVLNLPLARRIPSDARIRRLAELHRKRDGLLTQLGGSPR